MKLAVTASFVAHQACMQLLIRMRSISAGAGVSLADVSCCKKLTSIIKVNYTLTLRCPELILTITCKVTSKLGVIKLNALART